MQFKTSHGNFIATIPDSAVAKGCRNVLRKGELAEEVEVHLETTAKDISFLDLVDAIVHDVMWSDKFVVMAKKIKCHVTVRKNKNELTVNYWECYVTYLNEIAQQFKI